MIIRSIGERLLKRFQIAKEHQEYCVIMSIATEYGSGKALQLSKEIF